jgi:hypothetical protein
MACSHSTGCPLFPKLNASLSGWRDAYCDSDTGWQSCARFTQSLTGQSVPITLLPNGKYAHTVARASDIADAPQRSRFESVPRTGAAAPGSPFEEAPPQAPARVAPSVWDDPAPAARSARPSTLPRASAVKSPVLVRPAPPTPVRQPPPPPTPARTGWWTRLVDWMRGPA